MSDIDHTSVKPEVAHAFPWRRYWAKNVDFLLLTLVFASVVGQFIEDSALFDFLFYFVMVGVVVVYESFMLAKFQTTAGKWLLKVQVVKRDGSKISFDDSLARSWYCQAWGNGLCVPLLSFIANIIAYNKLNSTGTTSWDEKAGTRIEIGRLSTARKAVSALVIIGIYGFFIAATILAKQTD